MSKERFIEIYNQHIKREGADKLLAYLCDNSDFFTAPASARFHSSYTGGLCRHSLNVYECLADYMARERVQNRYNLNASDETIAIVSLLHDLCKINTYKPSIRNVKDESGVWRQVPSFSYDDKLPYGHGEKSVYIISGYMKLTREEAFAIRYHMGFSGNEDKGNVGSAFEMFPLAFALSTADMEATYFMEPSENNI
ncbi:MAG: hydrolase [Ruminococcaceae bacterium]|nr:hydrolase [Oscillospiraceae bacterium]